MAREYAVVTLLTSPAYLPGVLTAAHSLLDAEGRSPACDFDLVCLVTPDTVNVECIKALRQLFNLVVGVDAIDSKSTRELALLGRPELHATLTKLHLWRLTQYQRVIYLDADTLIQRPISHLFTTTSTHDFSAAPDIGWPDCFNSGVFVARPSDDTFHALMDMANTRGSWDGGDQGLLNDFFPNWNRLSFLYNVTPSASYQYEPAMRRYGQNISVIHFIGQHKPWERLNRSRSSPSSGRDYNDFLNRWFDVYEAHYGQMSTAELSAPSIASTGPQANFVVPFYSNAWDQRGRVEYRSPSPQELQARFGGKIAYEHNELGQYTNMALVTRGDARSSPPPKQPQEETPKVESQPERPYSPTMSPWNPATSAPDSQHLQMREPLDTSSYTNVWDDSSSSQIRTFFDAPQSHQVPQSIQSDYESVMRSARKDVKAVFPWEDRQQKAARVFPDDRQQTPLGAPLRPRSDSGSQSAKSSQSAQTPGLPVDFNYSNAWDSIKGIKKYADALAAPPDSPPKWNGESDKDKAARKGRAGRPREPSLDREGDEGDDEDEDERPPIKLKQPRTPISAPPRLPSGMRPSMYRAEGSIGSHSRVPTMAEMTASSSNDLPDLPGQRATGSITKSLNVPTQAGLLRKNSNPSPLASPVYNPNLRDMQAQAQQQHQSQPVGRVFSPLTDTGIVRKEGLAALQRFVKSMDQKGSTPPTS